MITLVILAVSFFLTMSLMRWTLRRSRNVRGDGIRWRGIDWSGVKKLEEGDDEVPVEKEEPPPDEIKA